MKFLLVNEINKYDSIGIELLSSCLKERGHECRVCIIPDLIENTTISLDILNLCRPLFYISDEDYIDYLLSFDPDVIGFSAVTSWIKRAAHLSCIVKKKAPNVITIVGGPHPTQVTGHTVRMDTFDYVCKGEGEVMMAELADALQRGEQNPDVPGVYWMKDGEVCGQGIGQLVKDLDTLPFPDKNDVISDYPYFEKVYMYNSMRSCAYNCIYCGSPDMRKEYDKFDMKAFRRKSVNKVIDELVRAKREYSNLKIIGFVDDTLTMGREWAMDFARKYKEQVGLPFFGCTNPVLFKDEEIITAFRDAGMVYVEIGVQVLDEEFRMKEVKRPDSDEDIFTSARLLRKHGIYIQVNHIFGLDKRDYHDTEFLRKTVEYYLDLQPNRTHCFELEYLPKTESSKRALENGDMTEEEYAAILKGENSVSYNFGGSIGAIKKFRPYIVLLEMRPFLPARAIRFLMYNRIAFSIIRRIPLSYLILARLLNTLIHPKDVEGRPHYGKYWYGMKHIVHIKRFLSKHKKQSQEKTYGR
ncbi:B12-binding domain-containing radical SAM protein [Desulfobacter vibrioformis]|uniref:B12-binding domain-containing radical SAM protein n=1 Tax=Desulfobacter vibrioformis TaxID=34031 RepID=UPI000555BF46|nr:radical SAM protein [Desulfobacter vibrioformis]